MGRARMVFSWRRKGRGRGPLALHLAVAVAVAVTVNELVLRVCCHEAPSAGIYVRNAKAWPPAGSAGAVQVSRDGEGWKSNMALRQRRYAE